MNQRVEVEVDDAGNLVLPDPVRRQLGLVPGMTLVVEQAQPDITYLRIQPNQPRLSDKQGVLVVDAELLDDMDNSVQHERDERINSLLQQARS
jgi:bifunctional DNA-binding transcriptional regulator/antitoxin component of YhaV-PrlF toxin-antitoxin module